MPATDGDDLFGFEPGPNHMAGGPGNDRYYVDDAGDTVEELEDEGIDTIYSLVSYALAAGTHVELLSTWAHGWQDPINLTGNSFDNEIWGNDGSNRLDGGGGTDHFHGLGGNDLYVVDSQSDLVFESVGGGRDTVYARSSYTLAADTDVEILSTWAHGEFDAIDLIGNDLDNELWGNLGANRLEGGAGNDVLRGLTGLIPFQDAVDVLVGGTGDDVYYPGRGWSGGSDTIIELPGEGIDTIYLPADAQFLTPDAEIEFLILSDPTRAGSLLGNAYGQTFIGGSGNDRFFGGGGKDIFFGFGGDDRYDVDSPDDEIHDTAGVSTVIARGSFALPAGLECYIFTSWDHGGTEPIDFMTGNEFDQQIYGNQVGQIMDGKGGNDLLQGMGGIDQYAFTTALGPANVDKIITFAAGSEKILLDDAVFGGLPLGTLSADAFVAGSAAQDADDRILFDPATKTLYFDADGDGAGSAIAFATIGTLSGTLAASDFTVI